MLQIGLMGRLIFQMVNALCLLLVSPPAWNMTLAGDVMLNGISPKKDPFAAIAKIAAASDVFVANLEIPLTAAKTPTPRKTPEMLKAKKQFVLKADPAHIGHLARSGLDAVSLGNNHAMDYGAQGLFEQMASLDKHGIGHCGAGADLSGATAPARIQAGSSPKIGMVSFLAFRGAKNRWVNTPATTASPGVAVLPFGGEIDAKARAKIKEIVARAREGADFVLVALHGGIERKTLPTAYQVGLARAFIDAGADAVVGHHPHVLQGAELYKDKPILYSTGNLVSALPGTTALFHLRFEGRRLVRAALTPCKIAKGAVVPMKAPQAKALLRAFDGLSAQVQKRYPHRGAKPLSSAYRAQTAIL